MSRASIDEAPAQSSAASEKSRRSARLQTLVSIPARLLHLKLRRVKQVNDVQDETAVMGEVNTSLTTLFAPHDGAVAADIIFIHGLDGGPFTTWSDFSAPDAICWPRDWLPFDSDFQHVRIHTFGYDTNWRQWRSGVCSIYGCAQSLLTHIKTHRQMKEDQTSVILVCHSLGGCIAKQTFILARQDWSLASRFQSIFFLATPHRGPNLANVLRNILRVAGHPKPSTKEVNDNVKPILEINEAFCQSAHALALWSFFESAPMPNAERFVVDKHSATLGLAHEEVSFINADHLHVCKYPDQSIYGYQKLRNAIVSTLDAIKPAPSRENARAMLHPYLGTDDCFHDAFVALQEMKAPGSCAWITQDTEFLDWASCRPGSPQVYCLVGGPGAGKSIISSHIVEYLRNNPGRCSYYFVKRGFGNDDMRRLLLSLAFQMASHDPSILRMIMHLKQQGDNLQMRGEIVWRQLFLGTIFKADPLSVHFWVLDGLDRASDIFDLLQMCEQIPPGLRILVTSRTISRIPDAGPAVIVRHMTPQDTRDDARSMVEAKLVTLTHLDVEGLCSRIVEESSGSFTWISLVLKELEAAFTEEDVDDILGESLGKGSSTMRLNES